MANYSKIRYFGKLPRKQGGKNPYRNWSFGKMKVTFRPPGWQGTRGKKMGFPA